MHQVVSRPERIDKMLSNLGYCSRREVRNLLRQGVVKANGIPILKPEQKVNHGQVTLDDQPLDPESLFILMNKPLGYTCSHRDGGPLIYELMPERYLLRSPKLSTVGRLDKDTTGVLLLTDDGDLLHRLTSPKKDILKVYQVTLEKPLNGKEEAVFSSGTLLLAEDDKPLLPAQLEPITELTARLTLREGRYHQVKRMFEAVGNQVIALDRVRFGDYTVEDLKPGEFELIDITIR